MPCSCASAATNAPGSKVLLHQLRLQCVALLAPRAFDDSLSMCATTGQMHAYKRGHPHGILLIHPPANKRALRPRLRFCPDRSSQNNTECAGAARIGAPVGEDIGPFVEHATVDDHGQRRVE